MKYILFISLLITSCKEEKNTEIVIDRFNNKHKYDRLPKKDENTLYCQIHYEWETIQYYYTREGVKYWMRTLKYF